MKRRIETGHLRHPWEVLSREADDRQRRGNVQGREGGCRFELAHHGIVDQAMAAKVRPAVHHAMPDRGRLGLFAVCEKRPDACDGIPWVRKFADSKTNCLSFASFAQNLPWRSPIDSASPERSTFGMEDSTW